MIFNLLFGELFDVILNLILNLIFIYKTLYYANYSSYLRQHLLKNIVIGWNHRLLLWATFFSVIAEIVDVKVWIVGG